MSSKYTSQHVHVAVKTKKKRKFLLKIVFDYALW